ncbi:MAG: aminotransferase class III-fold pyridoxal phosphate-dependent enzyme [Rhodobacteraceae bacterium]|nr:aminotransferase class III-fold pyridoxal phosphate-dependent enzyme [Paracoccaceae bacterium]
MKDDNFLKENNGRHLWQPMTHPAESQAHPPIMVTEGAGVRIRDIDGHETVDAVGGLWNVNLGYSNDAIKSAISNQLNRLPFYSTFRGTTNDAAVELSWMLREFFAPEELTRCFFTSGGSDSVETALRLARQYHKIRGEAGRTKYISLKNGYHGTHTLSGSVTGTSRNRSPYEPLMPGCYHIPAPYTYRNPFNESDPAKLAQLCLQALEDEIKFQGPETIVAFIMEPVMGAGGVIPPHETFMPGVREICDRHGILLVADEVICAFGRTGDWCGSRHWGVKPDLMTTAKAITNGYFPFGAVMISDRIAEVFENDTSGVGNIGTGYTYSGHPVGAAAAVVCLQETQRLNVKDNARDRGAELYAGLLELQTKYEAIGDVRGGHGLMCALELVADRDSKAPIDKGTINTLYETTYNAGTIVRISGPNVILSPPLVVTQEDVSTILSSLDAGFQAVS